MAEKKQITLKAEPRKLLGGRANLTLRMEGRLPAIVYGQKADPVAVSLDHVEFTDALHTGAHLVYLDAGGPPELVLIKDIQLNALGNDVLHVDFNRVDIHKKVRVPLPLEFRGKPVGAEEGGVLDTQLMQIEVECLPLDIPSEPLRVNIGDLKVGDILHVKDLKLPDTITAVTPGDALVASVKVPVDKEAPAATEEGAAEPEVLKKGKGEEEGAAAAGAEGAAGKKAEKK